MEMFKSLFFLFIPIFSGIFAANILMKDIKGIFLKICIGSGVGVGFSSVLFFLWKISVNKFSPLFFAIEILILIVLAVLSLKKFKFERPVFPKISATSIIPAGIFVLFLLTSLLLFKYISSNNIYGSWDGLRIINMTAKFIYKADFNWLNIFSVADSLSRFDYPLLLPLFIAKNWHYTGNDTCLIPVLTSALYTFGTVFLMMSGVLYFKNLNYALLAGIMLTGTQFFIVKGSNQYTDVSLSFYILSVFVLVFLSYKFDFDRRLLFLTGFLAGLAAWTKNEGIIFLVIFGLIYILFMFLNKRADLLKYLLSGCFLPVFCVIYFKLFIAPLNDIMDLQSVKNIILSVTDFSRYSKIFLAVFKSFYNIPLFLLPIFMMFTGIKLNFEHRNPFLISVITIVLCLFVYFSVYLTTPYNLDWHLATSLDRLLLHFWPSIIFICFIASRSNHNKQDKS